MAKKKISTVTVVPQPVVTVTPIVSTVKSAVIQNNTCGNLNFPDLQLMVGEIKTVAYTKRVKNYAGAKLIKVIKIF